MQVIKVTKFYEYVIFLIPFIFERSFNNFDDNLIFSLTFILINFLSTKHSINTFDCPKFRYFNTLLWHFKARIADNWPP